MLTPGQIHVLQEMLRGRPHELWSSLGIALRRSGKAWTGCCPVHGGDNPNACNVWLDGDMPATWRCYSQHCETRHKKSLLGFVRAVLETNAGKPVGFGSVLAFAMAVCGVQERDLVAPEGLQEREGFIRSVSSMNRPSRAPPAGVAREEVERRLAIPSPYFLSRGFKEETLMSYGVGDCLSPGLPFSSRAVAPVWDEDGAMAVGFTARSILPACPSCGQHHAGAGCPAPSAEHAKWRHSKGFRRESTLYNYARARLSIEAEGVVHVVEGPGDVWRLHEAGIKTAVGLFGSVMADEQQVVLETSGAMRAVVLLDPDEGGRAGMESMRERLRRLFRLEFPKLERDVGDTSVEELRRLLRG